MVLFFFFKQKTAYEMRISDWSSDVCSSDLVKENQNQIPLTQSALTEEKGLLWVSEEEIQDRMYPILEAADITDLPAIESYVDTSVLEEIGRASCRERVCQYV